MLCVSSELRELEFGPRTFPRFLKTQPIAQTTPQNGVLISTGTSFRVPNVLSCHVGTCLQNHSRFIHRHSLRSVIIQKRPGTLGAGVDSVRVCDTNAVARKDEE